MSLIDKIEALAKLHEQGLLSIEEFRQAKSALVSNDAIPLGLTSETLTDDYFLEESSAIHDLAPDTSLQKQHLQSRFLGLHFGGVKAVSSKNIFGLKFGHNAKQEFDYQNSYGSSVDETDHSYSDSSS